MARHIWNLCLREFECAEVMWIQIDYYPNRHHAAKQHFVCGSVMSHVWHTPKKRKPILLLYMLTIITIMIYKVHVCNNSPIFSQLSLYIILSPKFLNIITMYHTCIVYAIFSRRNYYTQTYIGWKNSKHLISWARRHLISYNQSFSSRTSAQMTKHMTN